MSESKVVVGRAHECDITLELASVSRQHAEIYRDGPVFAIRDLQSRNGTHLNGKRVSHAVLAAGDVLRVGDCVALVGGASAPMFSGLQELAPELLGGTTLAEVMEPVRRASVSSLPIVLVGETGAGKERFAHAIHHLSGRQGAFQAINCAALPSNLVEGELFGYRRGAFTGAERAFPGRLLLADGGTLLLDEIADLPHAAQAKLLRVIEDGLVVPLGSDSATPVNVRFIAASQRPLEALVSERTFRQDLRARLSGLVVHLPPLRARREEIPGLFAHFLNVHSGRCAPRLEAQFVEALCLHDWPDNVRELEMLARRLLALHGSEPLLKKSFLTLTAGEDLPGDATQIETLPAFQRRSEHDLHQLVIALEETKGNVSAAAASLGFSRQRAYRLMGGRSAAELLAARAENRDARSQTKASVGG